MMNQNEEHEDILFEEKKKRRIEGKREWELTENSPRNP